MKAILNNKVLLTAGAFILNSVFVLWEYFNGGVVTHHLLARGDMPGISNWWGLLTIPLLTWLTISLLHKRRNKNVKLGSNFENSKTKTLRRFLAALVFGIIASILWEFNFEGVLQYYILLPVLFAVFIPVHLPEYVLGFVIGMLFTFGGILPILFGMVLLVLCFLVNTLVRALKKLFLS